MESGELRRSAGLEADQEMPRPASLLCGLLPCDGDCPGWTDVGHYRWRWQRNIVETAEMAALGVRAAAAVFFGMVSVCRGLARQVAVASMMVDSRGDDVRDGLDRPRQ
jgi:hypothetical protein